MSENIVTGGDVNVPTNTEQGSLVPEQEPQSVMDNAATASAYFVNDAIQDTPQQPQEPQETLPPPIQAIPPMEQTSGIADSSGLPIQAIQPLTSVGSPPWLQNNSNIQQLMGDIPQWRDRILQNQMSGMIDPRQERTITDIPYAYPTSRPPLMDSETGSRLQSTFADMLQRDRMRALQSGLGGFMRIRPQGDPNAPENLSSNTNVPGSQRSIFRNTPRFGEPQNGWNGNTGTPVEQIEQQTERNRTNANRLFAPLRDIWNLLTNGEGAEEQREAFNNLVYEYVFGNPVTGESSGEPINDAVDTVRELSEMFPQTTGVGLEALQEVSPVPNDPNDPSSGYRVDWQNGYFGEYGRGWTGAFLQGLSMTENAAMAGVYSVTDLGWALSGQAGFDIPFIEDPHVDWDDITSLYRFRQAFGGVDLDVTNVRDGSGNRYLNFIDPNADRQTQIQQGAWALGLSALFGGGVDDVLTGGFRTSRLFAESMRRTGGNVGESLEMARRWERIQDMRRARQSVPTFEGISTPRAQAIAPTVGELPELSPSAGIVVNLNEYVAPLLTPDFAAANISPAQIAQEFNIDPMSQPPLPFFAPRTNPELLSMGQQLGMIDPDVNILTNADIARLQQVFGGAFTRFGPPAPPEIPVQQIGTRLELQRARMETEAQVSAMLEVGETPEVIRRTLDDDALVRTQKLQEQQNRALSTGEPGEAEVLRANELVKSTDDVGLTETVIFQVEEAPESIAQADTRMVQDYLIDTDNYTGAARGLQELEIEIDALRRQILPQSQRILASGDLYRYTRGNIGSEIATTNLYGDVFPGTQMQELLPPIEPLTTSGIASYDEFLEGLSIAEQSAIARGTPPTSSDIDQAIRALRSGDAQPINLDDALIAIERVDAEEFRQSFPDADFTELARKYGIDLDDPDLLTKVLAKQGSSTRVENFRVFDSVDEINRIRGRGTDSTNYFTQAYQDYVRRNTWYHGTKQTNIQQINFHHGAAHEWGVGLYLSNDVDYADVASRASRTEQNPVPGTTRIDPEGRGSVYQVQTNDARMLQASDMVAPDVLADFESSVRTIFGKRFAEYWKKQIGTPRTGEMWTRTRELFSEYKGERIPEVRYREFSREVATKLSERGYNGIDDTSSGMRLVFPDSTGRIPMNTTPVRQGLGSGNKMESLYARHWMDAELQQRIPSPTTEAWELQSRVKFENSMMEELMKAYTPAANQTEQLLHDMIQMERRLAADVHAKSQMDIEDLVESAPRAAIETPEFKQFDVPPDSPCM